jgi:quinol monooxygenase YgiN
MAMDQVAIWAVVESKPGKENEVEAFLKSAQPLAEREPETTSWYAVKIGPSKFGIFDTFPSEKGRQAHLSGEIAKALMAKAPELFSKAPEIHQISILASKTPKITGAASGHGD